MMSPSPSKNRRSKPKENEKPTTTKKKKKNEGENEREEDNSGGCSGGTDVDPCLLEQIPQPQYDSNNDHHDATLTSVSLKTNRYVALVARFVELFEDELYHLYGKRTFDYHHQLRCFLHFVRDYDAYYCASDKKTAKEQRELQKKKTTFQTNDNGPMLDASEVATITTATATATSLPSLATEATDARAFVLLIFRNWRRLINLAAMLANFDWDAHVLRVLSQQKLQQKQQHLSLAIGEGGNGSGGTDDTDEDETLRPLIDIFRQLKLDKDAKLVQCRQCRSWKVRFFFVQTRSSDEALTTKCLCRECGRTWIQPS